MITINTNVTELAAGFREISTFINMLESTWLPGFERSYIRRQDEYRRALQKHEERGFFLRTLLKTPKPPNRPPPGFKEEVSTRLNGEWRDTFKISQPSTDSPLITLFNETLDDGFYLLPRLQLLPNMLVQALLLGPSGVHLFAEADDTFTTSSSPATLARIWQQSAVEISALLQDLDWSGSPQTIPITGGILLDRPSDQLQEEMDPNSAVPLGDLDYWHGWLLANAAQDILDQDTVFCAADTLLERHHEITQSRTFSALTSAEKLTKQEKDNLLRLAATL